MYDGTKIISYNATRNFTVCGIDMESLLREEISNIYLFRDDCPTFRRDRNPGVGDVPNEDAAVIGSVATRTDS
jgi:hypothetical protein